MAALKVPWSALMMVVEMDVVKADPSARPLVLQKAARWAVTLVAHSALHLAVSLAGLSVPLWEDY